VATLHDPIIRMRTRNGKLVADTEFKRYRIDVSGFQGQVDAAVTQAIVQLAVTERFVGPDNWFLLPMELGLRQLSLGNLIRKGGLNPSSLRSEKLSAE
jgi:hypothetical protein